MNYQVHGNELYHHSILGQKWGVRRYQNPDGSLTPAGRERYGYGNGNGKSGSKTSSEKKTDPNHKLGSYEQEKELAEKVGKSALHKFEELYAKLDKGEISEEQYYEQMQKQVYDPILEAGFEWVSRSIGTDGYKHLQFGRELSDLEAEERNGEEWVQEWLIENNWPGITDLNKEW